MVAGKSTAVFSHCEDHVAFWLLCCHDLINKPLNPEMKTGSESGFSLIINQEGDISVASRPEARLSQS